MNQYSMRLMLDLAIYNMIAIVLSAVGFMISSNSLDYAHFMFLSNLRKNFLKNYRVLKREKVMLSRKCQGWIKTTGIMLMLWLLPATVFSQVVYKYEIIARTGETIVDPNPGGGNLGPISGLGRGPSINDQGKAAFIANAGTDVRLLLKGNTEARHA